MRPDALRELEEKTGINPARDVDQIVVAGTSGTGAGSLGLVLATGRFDLYKLGRTLETEGKVAGYNHDGATVYGFKPDSTPAMAIAFLDEGTLLFGQKARVEAAVSSHTRGEAPFRKNAILMALAEKVRPGSTFWMVGDQSLLAGMPTSVPAPAASGDGSMIGLPALKSLTVTGDLDPQVSLAVTGEATDDSRRRTWRTSSAA